jgi:hypothetical protein
MAQLRFRIGADGKLYAIENQTSQVFLIGTPSGTPVPPPDGGGGGSGSGNAVQKTGDSMSGPLAVVTSTQPELHVTDSGGVQTMDVNKAGLKVLDSGVGNSVEIGLAFINVFGSGAATGGSANKTTIGVNSLGIAHKSYGSGNSPVSFYQSNQGELFVHFAAGGQDYRLTDFANSRLFCPTNSLFMTSPTPGAAVVTLTLNDTGDIIATQTTGPNAGKSVNLTTGKWA